MTFSLTKIYNFLECLAPPCHLLPYYIAYIVCSISFYACQFYQCFRKREPVVPTFYLQEVYMNTYICSVKSHLCSIYVILPKQCTTPEYGSESMMLFVFFKKVSGI